MRVARVVMGMLAAVGFATGAMAQGNWPTKPVRIIVNFAPGGGTDNATRPYADRLSRIFGQQFVIENRAGASGTVGAESVIRSPADGYTFLATGSPVLTVVPQARKLNWDPFKDLTPVARFADYMLPIAVNPDFPAKTIQELQAYSVANPGKVNCGSAGLGTLTHMICETLKAYGKVDNTHIPYRGGADALNDFLAGITQIHSEPNVMPHVKAGKARLLAIADRERHPDYPNVPLISEIYPEIKIVGWYGLLAPAGTPPEIINKLNAEIQKIAALPELKPQFLGLALRPVQGSPEQTAQILKDDYAYFGAMIKAINLKLD